MIKNICSLLIFLVIPCFFCVVPNGTESDSVMNFRSSTDTISPLSSLNIVFSSPLADSSHFDAEFYPQVPDYWLSMALSKDTISITFSSPLEGGMKYSVKLRERLISELGQILLEGDSITFYTYSLEQEPNNDFFTSDTLKQKLFGTISTVDDTDFYVFPDSLIKKMYIVSFVSQTTFLMYDKNGAVIPDRQYKNNDTVTVPSSFVYPYYVKVFGYRYSSGEFYEIGF